jgi:predicted ATPase
MIKENCIILTGAPGSGKSTLLKLLREKGCTCIDEPARQIIAEQRHIGGSGVADKNPSLFLELMLSRAMFQYDNVSDDKTVIFDRGVADNIAYAELFDLSFLHLWAASEACRANPVVFFAPNWHDIYTTDEERKMSYEASAAMGNRLRDIYQKLGYRLIDLPLSSTEERVQFLLDNSPKSLLGEKELS